jgi:hypothetical protein
MFSRSAQTQSFYYYTTALRVASGTADYNGLFLYSRTTAVKPQFYTHEIAAETSYGSEKRWDGNVSSWEALPSNGSTDVTVCMEMLNCAHALYVTRVLQILTSIRNKL